MLDIVSLHRLHHSWLFLFISYHSMCNIFISSFFFDNTFSSGIDVRRFGRHLICKYAMTRWSYFVFYFIRSVNFFSSSLYSMDLSDLFHIDIARHALQLYVQRYFFRQPLITLSFSTVKTKKMLIENFDRTWFVWHYCASIIIIMKKNYIHAKAKLS